MIQISRTTKFFVACILVSSGVGALIFFSQENELTSKLNVATLRHWMDGLGLWGPVAVVGLMATAILVSPLPSAPIALAAGAVYGHVWGTLYVVIGSELGAIGAFGLARFFGRDFLLDWFGDRLKVGLAGSQSVLMGAVLFSRLMPFVSFDLISYAAGLTVLTFWRFTVATLVGIIPASFLLAHFGGELAGGEQRQIVLTSIILGATVVLFPLLVRVLHVRKGG
jgi:uncharacterized membrane protein YdjX (TVP38/TMEM64 family)